MKLLIEADVSYDLLTVFLKISADFSTAKRLL